MNSFKIRTATILASVALLAAPAAAFAAIGTPTNLGSASATSGTTLSVTTGASVSVGNTIIVTVASDGNNGALSISDTGGNTYTKDADQSSGNGGGNDVRVTIWSAPVTTALSSGASITVHSPNLAKSVHAAQVSGLLTSSSVDKTATATNTGTSASSGNTTTTSQSNELLIGAVGAALSTLNITGASSPWTSFPQVTPGVNGTTLLPEYQIVSSTGAYATTGTLSGAGGIWSAAIVTYKAALTSTVTAVSAPTPSVVGETYTVSWTVSHSGGGTPTGTVTISGDGAGCSAPVTANSCQVTSTSPGAKTLVGTYGGDSAFSGSTSAGAAHQVNKADTTTAISLSSTPTITGEAYTVNWILSVTAPGAGTPTGTVTVTDGTDTCFGTLPTASCNLVSTLSGTKNITATYNGDSNFNTSTSLGASHVVNNPPTAPIFLSPANGTRVNSGGVNVSGTADANATVVISGGSSVATTTADGSGNWSTTVQLNFGPNVDTTNNLSAVGIDAGNHYSGATPLTVVMDNTTPVLTLSSVTSNPTNTTPVPFAVHFSESVSDFTDADLSVVGGTPDALVGSGQDYTFNVTPSADPSTITVSIAANAAHDAAGNGSNGISLVRTFDSTALTLNVTAPTEGAFFSNGIVQSDFTSNASETDCSVDGGVFAVCTSPFSTPSLGDGTHFVTINASSTGNTIVSVIRHFTIDTAMPTIDSASDVTVISPDGNPVVVSYTTPTAHDAIDTGITASCLPASGTPFAVGDTAVTCNATDTAGNPAVPVAFNVHVHTVSTQTIVVGAADLDNTSTNPALVIGDGLNKWFAYDDTNDTINNSLATFVLGPVTPPLGTGSVQFTATSSLYRGNIATYQFAGTLLSNITSLAYSAYSHAGVAGPNESPFLAFNVDFTGSNSWQKRLVYVPSANGAVPQDTWNTNDTINGGAGLWTWSGYAKGPNGVTGGGDDNTWPDGNASEYRTWSAIKAAFPSARILATGGWLGVRVGEPGPANYVGNVDKIVVGIQTGSNINTATYNFESDTVVPVITLTGSATVNLTVGDSYSDAGATATDDVDGDITAHIVTGGLPVDTSAVGTHTVTYDVSDAAGNHAVQVTRTVNVSAPAPAPTTTTTSGGGGNGPIVGSGGFGFNGSVLGASTSNVNGGQVLGATTSNVGGTSCVSSALLTKYMRRGQSNDSNEVKKLQGFLNAEMSAGLPLTGFFGPLTEASVKAFQTKYATDILTPWGLTQPTGYVYKLTLWKINGITCANLNAPKPTI